jgi:peptidoglycan/xylan/chitin deacetylase (PgdA/CDA1 family)
MSLRRLPICSAFALVAACSSPEELEPFAPQASGPAWEASPRARAPAPYEPRGQIDGRAFPDRVVALTYDDGPDAHTLALAQYLRANRASATFFVVKEWAPGVSSDPGQGEHVFATGHAHIPVLGEIVALGHRLGNHTATHALLGEISMERDFEELRENQVAIDPFLTSEARFFRAPGGEWTTLASRAVDEDPALRGLLGPIRWDVDRKDWENSLACDSPRAATECERAGPGGRSRIKASVTAAHYLASIESAGRGIVLFHDRVGHVGSEYALDVARRVVPALVARGFVFAPPVLAFSPMARRGDLAGPLGAGALSIEDVDGDGRGDVCAGDGARDCLRSVARFEAGDAMPRVALVPFAGNAMPRVTRSKARRAPHTGDLNGDGRDDVCELGKDGVACAFGSVRGLTRPTIWLAPSAVAPDAEWALGDVSGDGRADLCARVAGGIDCALAP